MSDILDRMKRWRNIEEAALVIDQAADEITRLRQDNRQILEDEAETITAVREESRKVLATIDVDGDSYAVPSVEDIVGSLVAEIARLRDELKSTTRHMELTEAAWLRETAGNSPVAVVITDEEREAVEQVALFLEYKFLEYDASVALSEDIAQKARKDAATLRGLLNRSGGDR